MSSVATNNIPIINLPNPPRHDLVTKLYDNSDDDDLLDLINRQQSDDYRLVKFRIDDQKVNNDYTNRVGFDTINIKYVDSDIIPEEMHLLNSINNSPASLSPYQNNERGRSKSPSSSPRVLSPYGGNTSIDNSLYFDPNEIKRMLSNNNKLRYPTSSIITHRGCTYTKVHRKFEDLITNKIPNRKPMLRGRVILVYISGRKHTWVALDWVLRYFIEDGDTIIVVSAIDSKRLAKPNTGHSYQGTLGSGTIVPRNTPLSPNRVNFNPKTAKMRLRQRNSPEYMTTLSQNIMNYAMEVINPKIIAKVTLELAVGKTREILQQMYKLYEPNLVCTATKVNTHVSAPLRSWTSSKLTDRLVFQFPLPLIIVPAMNMINMELKLQNEITLKHSDHTKDWDYKSDETNPLGIAILKKIKSDADIVGQKSDLPNDAPIDDTKSASSPEVLSDNVSIQSDSSIASVNSSIVSNESYDSYEEISKLFYEYKKDVKNSIHKLKKNPIDENYFANFLISISDKSARFCDDVRDVDPDFKGKGAKLARAITGSVSFGVSPYKTKSLLNAVEEPKKQEGVRSFQDIKRGLKMNALQAPEIKVDSASPTSSNPPSSTSLKFINLENPSKKKSSTKAKSLSTSDFSKVLSHELKTENNRPELTPRRSHPLLSPPASADYDGLSSPTEKERKTRKKKRFWGKLLGI